MNQLTISSPRQFKNREQDLILSKWMTFAGREELKNREQDLDFSEMDENLALEAIQMQRVKS